MEFRYHGSVATSSTSLFRELGIHDQGLLQAAKAASEAAEKRNLWLWLKRKGTSLCAMYGYISHVCNTANISVNSVFKQYFLLAV